MCVTLRRQKVGSAENSWRGMSLLGFLFVNNFEGAGNVFLMLGAIEEYSL